MHRSTNCRAFHLCRLAAFAVLCLGAASAARAQSGGAAQQQERPEASEADAREADGDAPRGFVKFNQFEMKRFSLRWGGGFLYDYAGYSPNDTRK